MSRAVRSGGRCCSSTRPRRRARAGPRRPRGQHKDSNIDPDRFLRRASGHSFYNRPRPTPKKIAADPQNAAQNLTVYVAAFSDNAGGALDRFEFAQQIKRLDSAGLLYQVIGRFTDLDLRPETASSHTLRSQEGLSP
ncbi:hypothetical protein M2169_001252 [Streptomyces sp. MJP52]|nr:hypothetical protein [Streptomyces sp. MJP52]